MFKTGEIVIDANHKNRHIVLTQSYEKQYTLVLNVDYSCSWFFTEDIIRTGECYPQLKEMIDKLKEGV